MSSQCHFVQKYNKVSGKQTNLIQGQLKNDFLRNFPSSALISTPFSGKSLSVIYSPETQKLNERIQEELSQLDEVPIYHFPQMYNREEDKMQYQVQTMQFLKGQESQMLEAILNYKRKRWDMILPINEFISEQNCQGFWILKIITKNSQNSTIMIIPKNQ